MSPALHPARSATVLGLALLLTACGGGEPEQTAEAPDAGAADAGQENPEETAELVDPMELAPDDLCQVLSEETLTELLGPAEDRAGDQEGTGGVPEPGDVERLGGISLSCITVSVSLDPPRSHSLTYRLEIKEGPYEDEAVAPAEEDADPSVGLGDYAVVEAASEGTDVTLDVVDGQMGVSVDYTAAEVVDYEHVSYLEEDEMVARAARVAEEVLAATGA
ncbi:hypothetical protein [Nocardiopsis halotolerans]|uniref:hypothetical protein n=1 Tax=Nocardiopsis halotolerans TaxID=124252 RepID=UPI000345F747|nr:hypothetical protein [Nocardiopsis halotolerans]